MRSQGSTANHSRNVVRCFGGMRSRLGFINCEDGDPPNWLLISANMAGKRREGRRERRRAQQQSEYPGEIPEAVQGIQRPVMVFVWKGRVRQAVFDVVAATAFVIRDQIVGILDV